MQDYDNATAPLAATLRRFAVQRSRLLWVRVAAIMWGAAALAWLLPVEPWSATHLPARPASTCLALFALSCAAIVWLHEKFSDTREIRRALIAIRSESDGGQPPVD
jgi:hypothetical protein